MLHSKLESDQQIRPQNALSLVTIVNLVTYLYSEFFRSLSRGPSLFVYICCIYLNVIASYQKMLKVVFIATLPGARH